MPELLPQLAVLAVALPGGGGTLAGLIGLLKWRSGGACGHRWMMAALVVSLLASAGAAAALEQFDIFGWPSLVLGGCCALFLIVQTAWVERLWVLTLQVMRRPSWQWGLVLAVSPVLALICAYRAERDTSGWEIDPALAAASDPVPLDAISPCSTITDAGQFVPLFRAAIPPPPSHELNATEAAVLRSRMLDGRVIRTGDANLEHNCHGWIFTGGRCWLRGSDIDSILKDNGYCPVDAPRANDLAIYRDLQGGIVHSGIVTAIIPDQFVLIESKWGKIGRFLHPHDAHPYPTQQLTYYRSPRPGHLLRNLPAESAPTEGGFRVGG